MRDRQPFKERKGRCLRHSVRGGEDMIEETGGGDCAEQISLAALEHSRQRVARNENVAHQVNVPNALPLIGWRLGTTTDRDAGVGAKNVYPTMLCLDSIHQLLHVGLARH